MSSRAQRSKPTGLTASPAVALNARRSEQIAHRYTADLNVVAVPAVVDWGSRQACRAKRNCPRDKGCRAARGIVDLVVEMLGSQQDVRRRVPLRATAHNPTGLCRVERRVTERGQSPWLCTSYLIPIPAGMYDSMQPGTSKSIILSPWATRRSRSDPLRSYMDRKAVANPANRRGRVFYGRTST